MIHNNSNEIMNLSSTEFDEDFSNPKIIIEEEPASTGIRFRYECEGRSSGSIPGENSTEQRITYPKIRINYNGPERILIVVSCVTENWPHRVHPHNLVGAGCHDGIYKVVLERGVRTAEFKTLGIQCVKRPDMQASLQLRRRKKVDPFKQGYQLGNGTIDQNTVRLCFQAFIVTENKRKPLRPVVSKPIYNKKFLKELHIAKLSLCCASAEGGNEIMMFTENINKNVKVRFYDTEWEAYAEASYVHHREGLSVIIPSYKNTDITQDVYVQIQLVNNNFKDKTSNPVRFKYTPSEILRRKKARSAHEKFSLLQCDITAACRLNQHQQTHIEDPLLPIAYTPESQSTSRNNHMPKMCNNPDEPMHYWQLADSQPSLRQDQPIINEMAARDEGNHAQTLKMRNNANEPMYHWQLADSQPSLRQDQPIINEMVVRDEGNDAQTPLEEIVDTELYNTDNPIDYDDYWPQELSELSIDEDIYHN